MNLKNASFMLAPCLWLLGCGQHQTMVPTLSQNAQQQPIESQAQAQKPSPVITPTPELEVAFGKRLKIVPKTVEMENQRRRYQIGVVYPQIEGSHCAGILKLNRRIKDLVSRRYQWPLISPTKNDLRYYEKWPGVFNSVDLTYEVVLATDELLSIYFEVYSYGIGAAHSVQQSFTVNFDLQSEELITLAGLFRPRAGHLEFISDYCLRELSKELAKSDPIFKNELAPKVKNFESWNLTKKGLRFNFDACRIGGCGAGKAEMTIPFTALKEKLKPSVR